jgi:thiosulfate reductase cytochrome b subunit
MGVKGHEMHRTYVHPLPVRLWHWINAAGFVAMIVTGVQIRYVGIVDIMSFRTAVTWHNWIGFVLIANFFIWFLYYLCTDKIRNYLPELDARKHFTKAFRQIRYYGYGMFVGEPEPYKITPYDKFNPMQSMLYQVVMLIVVPFQFYTGLLLWDVKRFAGQVDFFGGVRIVDTIHVLIFIFFVLYMIMHAYLGTLGHTRTVQYKAMFTGWHEEDEHDETPADPAASAAKHT